MDWGSPRAPEEGDLESRGVRHVLRPGSRSSGFLVGREWVASGCRRRIFRVTSADALVCPRTLSFPVDKRLPFSDLSTATL